MANEAPQSLQVLARNLGNAIAYNQMHKPAQPPIEKPPDDSLAAGFIKALANHTINDISYEQMSRIAHRLAGMPARDRAAPKRVADVLINELGPEKALSYVEKAYANGNIKQKDYFEMRTYIILPMPRSEIPPTLAGINTKQLLYGQKKIQQEFGALTDAGKELLRKPFDDLNKDVTRIKRAWGVK